MQGTTNQVLNIQASNPSNVGTSLWTPGVVSHNSCGLGRTSKKYFGAAKFSALNIVLNDSSLDLQFICLQETKSHVNQTFQGARPFGRKFKFITHSATNACSADGVIIFARDNLTLITSETWTEGRVLYTCFRHPEYANKTHLINVYGHTTLKAGTNANSVLLIQNIVTRLQNIATGPTDNILICGDFNFDIHISPRSLKQITEELFYNFNLKDCFNAGRTTWRGTGRRANLKSRIDYVLSNHINNYNYCRQYSNSFSDHMILVVAHKNTSSNSIKQTRYNANILQNKLFREQLITNLNKFLCTTLKKPFIDDKKSFVQLDNSVLYENLPFKAATLLNTLISITKKNHDLCLKKHAESQFSLEKKYQNSFNKLCSAIDRQPDNEQLSVELRNLRNERKNEITTAKNRATDLFEKISAKENGKPTSHAFRPFKNRDDGKKINLLKVNGREYTDPVDIIKIMTNFHIEKTSSVRVDHEDESVPPQPESNATPQQIINEVLDTYDIEFDDIFPSFPEVTDVAPFSTTAINDVIKTFKTISSPGPSGQSKQFYSTLMSILPNIMTSTINFLANLNTFERTPFNWIKKRNIIMLHKKKMERTDPSSYRPISLLEMLYKIISKLLTYQLDVHIPSIVHSDQYGFVKGRQMSVASHTVLALLQELSKGDEAVCAMFLDIKAAFDSALPGALLYITKRIFPMSNLPDLIHNLTNRGIANLLVNGEYGKLFLLCLGCGQGDPISAARYLILHHLFIMFLFYAIKNSTIHNSMCVRMVGGGGIMRCIPPLAYADDTQKCLIFRTHEDVKFWCKIRDDAAKMTGLTINRSKTQILLTGDARRRALALPLAMQVGKVVDEVEHLGIIVCLDPVKGRDKTYIALQSKVNKSIVHFKTKSASTDIFHKKVLVQALISSQMIHVFRAYPPTEEFLKEAWKQIRDALWTYTYEGELHGRAKVAENRITAPISKGGLGFISPKMAADTAYIGALRAILVHSLEYKCCTLNYLFQVSDTDRKERIVNWGSKSILRSTQWLLRMIPFSEGKIKMLSNTLAGMEAHPDYFYRSSLFGSIFSSDFYLHSTGHLYGQIHTISEVLELDDEQTVVQVKHNYTRLDSPVRDFFNQMAELLKEKNLSLPPWQIVGSPDRRTPMFDHFLHRDRHYIINAYKMLYKRKFENFCPPAYVTRLKDGVDAPRDANNFLKAYSFLANTSEIESKLKSFQFELLNRTLRSPNKAFKMRQIPSNLCSLCSNNIVADTSHTVAHCVIPIFFIRIFNEFCKVNLKLNKFKLTSTLFEFSCPSPKLISKSTEIQIQHLFYAVKHFALKAHFEERFTRWSKLIYFAKILNIVKLTSDVRKFAKCTYDILADFLNFLIENQYLIEN